VIRVRLATKGGSRGKDRFIIWIGSRLYHLSRKELEGVLVQIERLLKKSMASRSNGVSGIPQTCSTCACRRHLPATWGWSGGSPAETHCAFIECEGGAKFEAAQNFRAGKAEARECPGYQYDKEGL
jgi:hypothetical protein